MNTPTPNPIAPKRGPGRPPKSESERAPRKRQKPMRKSIPIAARGASPEARKRAAAILEVFGGVRSTTSAAEALGCSVPRYYHLEGRALEGLLAACEPRKPGRSASTSARELESLRKKCERLEREVGRQQALVRSAHRTIGLIAPPQPKAKPKRGQRKRPVARALVAAELLRSEPATPAAPSPPIP
ncbi:MAG: hypothetical protein ACAI25_10100 [Planctomycetota bacterium]